MGERCSCDCHRLSNIAPAEGPLVIDPIAAVWACKRCENEHCAAILYRPPVAPKDTWTDPPFPPPAEAADNDGN